jgi:hypothetical protein
MVVGPKDEFEDASDDERNEQQPGAEQARETLPGLVTPCYHSSSTLSISL